jgi:hypothetical protein
MLQAPANNAVFTILKHLPISNFRDEVIHHLWSELTFAQLIEPISEGPFKGRDLLWIAANEVGKGDAHLFNRLWAKFENQLNCEHFLVTREGHEEFTAALWTLINDADNKGANRTFCRVFNKFKNDISHHLIKQLAENSPFLWKIAFTTGSDDQDMVFQQIWTQFKDQIPHASFLQLRQESTSALWHLAFGYWAEDSASFEKVWKTHKNNIPLKALLSTAGRPSDFEGASCLWFISHKAAKNAQNELFLKIYEKYQDELTIEDLLPRFSLPDEDDSAAQSVLDLFMAPEAFPQKNDSILRLLLSETPGILPERLFDKLKNLGLMDLVKARNDFFLKLETAKKQPFGTGLLAELLHAAEKAHRSGYHNAYNDIGKYERSISKAMVEVASLANAPTLRFIPAAAVQTPEVASQVGEKRKLRHSH